jgi:hypothetical protein
VIIICFLFSLGPATAWVVAGYVVLYISSRADGGMRTAGRVLSLWLFFIALLIPLVGFYITIKGLCPVDAFIASMGAI